MNKFIYNDEVLGEMRVCFHPAARRFIFRNGKDGLQVTAPVSVGEKDVAEVVDRNREKLKKMLDRTPDKRLYEGREIETLAFRISVRRGKTIGFRFSLKNGVLDICCPENTDFSCTSVQAILERGIKSFVKRSAKIYLPARAAGLARQAGISFREIAVSYGRKRLGKCDIHRVVTLSYYLMFLPEEICDYVIYHELAHLTEMNHGEVFHRICNRYCGGREKELERALKGFVFPID